MRLSGKFLAVILLSGWSFSASAQTSSDIDGVWRLHGFRCHAGQVIKNVDEKNPDFTMTFSFDTVALKSQMKVGYLNGKCTDVVEYSMRIQENKILIEKPRLISSNCNLATHDSNGVFDFVFSKLPSGENALILENSAEGVCTGVNKSDVILTMIPIG